MLDDAVLEDEPALVEPRRVVGVPRRATANVARQHAREEPLGVPPCDAVLVQRRGVEDADAVPDGEVLELVRRLVARHDHVPGPVLPQAGVVQRAGPLVEWRGADHRARAYRLARRGAGSGLSVRRLLTRGGLEALLDGLDEVGEVERLPHDGGEGLEARGLLVVDGGDEDDRDVAVLGPLTQRVDDL